MASIPFREKIGCSVEEACAVLGVGTTMAYEMLNNGILESFQIGRRRIVKVSSILRVAGEAKPTEQQAA